MNFDISPRARRITSGVLGTATLVLSVLAVLAHREHIDPSYAAKLTGIAVFTGYSALMALAPKLALQLADALFRRTLLTASLADLFVRAVDVRTPVGPSDAGSTAGPVDTSRMMLSGAAEAIERVEAQLLGSVAVRASRASLLLVVLAVGIFGATGWFAYDVLRALAASGGSTSFAWETIGVSMSSSPASPFVVVATSAAVGIAAGSAVALLRMAASSRREEHRVRQQQMRFARGRIALLVASYSDDITLHGSAIEKVLAALLAVAEDEPNDEDKVPQDEPQGESMLTQISAVAAVGKAVGEAMATIHQATADEKK